MSETLMNPKISGFDTAFLASNPGINPSKPGIPPPSAAILALNQQPSGSQLIALQGKSIVGKTMETNISNTLLNLNVFVMSFRQDCATANRRDRGEIIIALFRCVAEEMKKFEKNLRKVKDLENLRMGRRVEKVSKSKTSKERESES